MKAAFLVKDRSLVEDVVNDSLALACDYHRVNKCIQSFDSADECENVIKFVYVQDLYHAYTKKYPNIHFYRLMIFLPQDPAKDLLPDALAFQLGHMVQGQALLLKNKCFKCLTQWDDRFMPCCSACRIAQYCCRECQVADRSRHVGMCKMVARDIRDNQRATVERPAVEFTLDLLFP